MQNNLYAVLHTYSYCTSDLNGVILTGSDGLPVLEPVNLHKRVADWVKLSFEVSVLALMHISEVHQGLDKGRFDAALVVHGGGSLVA